MHVLPESERIHVWLGTPWIDRAKIKTRKEFVQVLDALGHTELFKGTIS